MAVNTERHVHIVCCILKVIGFLYLIGVMAILVLGTATLFGDGHAGDIPNSQVSLTGFMLLLPLALFGILHILAARGFQENERWGRVLLWVLSLLNLTSLPLGTAFGAYSIWVLYRTGEN